MIPEFYQNHLKSQLSTSEFIFLKILINLIQSIKKVNLEQLANALPLPIKFESRRKRIQRFLSLPNLQIEKVWFPIIKTWLSSYFTAGELIYLAIDRTNWSTLNLLMISVVWQKRAFPIYFELLPKLGSSNIKESGRTERRHSSFYIGLYGQTWVNFQHICMELVQELMRLNPNKLKYYQRGLKAMKLVESTF